MLGESARPLRQRYTTLLVDLDGVVYLGRNPVPRAVQALDDARGDGCGVFFVTNNAARLPAAVAKRLTDLGVQADPDEVITSSQASAQMLRSRVADGRLPEQARVLVVGAEGLRRAVTDAGFELVESADDHPDAVVQGYNADTSWRDLAEAAYAVGAGAYWLASNTDAALPTERGSAPGNGAMVQAVAMATGARPEVAGKPERALFDTALQTTGAEADDALMIGDRLDSDIAGARAADLASLLVLTGVSGLRELFDAPEPHRPTFVGFDLDALAEPQPSVQLDGENVTCQGWLVRPDGDTLRLDGDGSPTPALRAATVACWRANERGGHTDRQQVLAALEALRGDGHRRDR